MATARVQVSPPEPFWDNSADALPNFWPWFARFKIWLALTEAQLPDGTMLSREVKNRYLFQLLGREGSRSFSTEREVEAVATTAHDAFCTAATNFFYRPTNKVRARHKFFMRHQTSGESVHD